MIWWRGELSRYISKLIDRWKYTIIGKNLFNLPFFRKASANTGSPLKVTNAR